MENLKQIATNLIIKAFNQCEWLNHNVGIIETDNKIIFVYHDGIIKVWLMSNDYLLNACAEGHITYLQMKYVVKVIKTIEDTLETLQKGYKNNETK